MKHCVYLLVLLGVILLPCLAFAGDYTVDASSHNWMAQRDYSEYKIADDDPSTAWAEGGKGAGEGEWVSFDFESELNLARIGVRNGDQRAESWETCNRVHEMRVEYGHGREKIVELRNQTGLQYVDIQADSVGELKLTIVSVYPANNIWNRSVTCISDVFFEAYADKAQLTPDMADRSATSDTTIATDNDLALPPDVAEPVSPKDVSEIQDEAVVAPGDSVDGQPSTLASTSSVTSQKPEKTLAENAEAVDDVTGTAESAKDENASAQEKPAAPAKIMADPSAEAVQTVREYYTRLNTLDESFPDLMAAKIYEQEVLSFFYFEEIQKQLGTADQLRRAKVDLSDLTIEVENITDASARVTSKGAYLIATPGQKLIVDEHSRFNLILENDTWKIEKKVEED